LLVLNQYAASWTSEIKNQLISLSFHAIKGNQDNDDISRGFTANYDSILRQCMDLGQVSAAVDCRTTNITCETVMDWMKKNRRMQK